MNETYPIVHAPAGSFRGIREARARVWRGIRYAKPPTGELRWRDPVAVPPADETVDALIYGPAAPQLANAAVPLGEGTRIDEACLSPNVWAPPTQQQAALPVMVWIHGGAYTFGSSAQPLFNGASPVSYTHLDVYKRQGEKPGNPRGRCANQGRLCRRPARGRTRARGGRGAALSELCRPGGSARCRVNRTFFRSRDELGVACVSYSPRNGAHDARSCLLYTSRCV